MTQTKAEKIQARDFIPKSNTEAGRRILANAPPDAPGYGQFWGFLSAVIGRKIEPVDIMPVVPDDVSAHPDIIFQTIGNRKMELDIFVPRKADKPAPLIVLIHGGCWMAGTRKDMGFYAIKLAQRGYATASVDYRLSEEATYPAAVEDCRAAIQWLKDHAGSYNFDADRIALFGGSAGGHLVEFLGYSATTPTQRHPKGPGPKVNAIVAFYGWSDLTDPTVKDFYWNELFLGKKYEEDPKLYKEASPLFHVCKESPATLLLHGTIDTIVPISQSEKLVKKLEENNVPYVYAPFKGGYHAYDIFKNTNPGAMYFIEEFLREYLAK